jgi:hypothetical protein
MKRGIWRIAGYGSIGIIGLVAAIGVAGAQTCDPRWPTVQFARDDLQRAATEGDLPTAQDYADRTRREFNHLAELSTRCGCTDAAAQFEAAAKQIRPAVGAESRRALRDIAVAVKPVLDAGLAKLQECGRR